MADEEQQARDGNAQGGGDIPEPQEEMELIYEGEGDQGVPQPHTRSRADKAALLAGLPSGLGKPLTSGGGKGKGKTVYVAPTNPGGNGGGNGQEKKEPLPEEGDEPKGGELTVNGGRETMNVDDPNGGEDHVQGLIEGITQGRSFRSAIAKNPEELACCTAAQSTALGKKTVPLDKNKLPPSKLTNGVGKEGGIIQSATKDDGFVRPSVPPDKRHVKARVKNQYCCSGTKCACAEHNRTGIKYTSEECWVLHPELVPDKMKKAREERIKTSAGSQPNGGASKQDTPADAKSAGDSAKKPDSVGKGSGSSDGKGSGNTQKPSSN